jgi:hypothetical protein
MAYLGNAPGQSTQRVTTTFTTTEGQTSFTPVSGYTPGYVDVYLNGVKLIDTDDYVATNGVTIVLNTASSVDNTLEVVAYIPRGLSDGYTKLEADARYEPIDSAYTKAEADGKYLLNTTDTFTGDLNVTGTVTTDGLTSVGVSGTTIIQALGADSNGNADVEVKSTGTSGSSRLFFADTAGQSGAIKYAHSTDSMLFSTNGTEQALIDSDGNLLVGTTTKGIAETTNQGINILGQYGAIEASRPNNSSLYLNRASSDGAIATFRKDGSTVGSIGTSTGDLTIGTAAMGLKFRDGDQDLIPWNTTTNGTATGVFDLGDLTNQFKDLYLSGAVKAGDNSTFYEGAGGDAILSSSNSGADIFISGARNTRFFNGGPESMRIDSDGHVGIGTVPKTWQSQSTALEIGDISIEDYAVGGANAANILFNAYRDYTNGFVRKVDGAGAHFGSYLGDFIISTFASGAADTAVNSTKRLVIKNSGNVGIGTDNPQFPLHVLSDGNEGIFMEGTGGGHWFNFRSATSNLWSMGAQTGKMGFYNRTDSTYKMVIADDGKVGIANVNPNATLHVTGNAAFQKQGNANRGNLILGEHGSGFSKWSALAATHYDDATGSGNGSGSAGVMLIGSFSDDTMNRVYIGHGPYEVNPATEIRLGTHTSTTHTTGGTTHMTITSLGNVGIGTAGPTKKLEVTGETLVNGGVGVPSTGIFHVRQSGDTKDNGIAITSSNSTSHRIWKDGAGALSIGTPVNSRAVKIDLNGIMTKPYHPVFDVAYSGSGYNATTTVLFDQVYVNVGSHYNASTGRFTAPVDGVYTFYTTQIKNNDSPNVARRKFLKNGSTTHNSRHLRLDLDQPYGDNGTLVMTTSLVAGDYIEVQVFAGSSYGTREYDYFGGYLIG